MAKSGARTTAAKTAVKAKTRVINADPKPGSNKGLTGFLNRLLTGEDGEPVIVYVEPVNKTPQLLVEYNLATKGDFDKLDFYLPLSILFLNLIIMSIPTIAVVQQFIIVIALQVVLLRDLIKRVKRKPSSKPLVGLRPHFRQFGWGWAFCVYLVSVPFLFGAGWLNQRLWFHVIRLLFFNSLPAAPDPIDELGFLQGATALPLASAVGVGVSLFFFSIVILQAVIFAPITEEIWFRGIGLTVFLRKIHNPVQAAIWTSIIFGALHGPSRFMFATLFGAVIAIIRFRTGSLYICIAIHALHNFAVCLISFLPLLTSG